MQFINATDQLLFNLAGRVQRVPVFLAKLARGDSDQGLCPGVLRWVCRHPLVPAHLCSQINTGEYSLSAFSKGEREPSFELYPPCPDPND
jgi:hypothetical protein